MTAPGMIGPGLMLLLLWAPIILGIVVLVLWLVGGHVGRRPEEDLALTIFRERYPRGEIGMGDDEAGKNDFCT